MSCFIIAAFLCACNDVKPFGDTILAHEHLTYDDLLRIVELIKSTEHFSEFRLKVGEIELELRHRKLGHADACCTACGARSHRTRGHEAGRALTMRAGCARNWPEGLGRYPLADDRNVLSRTGARRTCIRRSGAGGEPDDVVGIIEVMKLMNSIPAGCAAQLRDTGRRRSPVEAGQPLIVMQPKQMARMTLRRPIRRVLIANRARLQCACIRACRELGLEAIQVYSEADRDSLRSADWQIARFASARRPRRKVICAAIC